MARATTLDPSACRAVVDDPRAWRTTPEGECVVWVGVRTRRGYGRVMVSGRQKNAHRVALIAHTGVDVPGHMVVDHLCKNPPCVNPDHLEAVTERVNVLRGTAPPALNARRTHCLRGHPLEGENLYPTSLRRGERACATCVKLLANRRNRLINSAVHASGLTHDAYRKAHGTSAAAALAVLGVDMETWEAEGGVA